MKQTVPRGTPTLIDGTDLQVTYRAGAPDLVERVRSDGAVLQSFVAAPEQPLVMPLADYWMSCGGDPLVEWLVQIEPDGDHAVVHVGEAKDLLPKYWEALS